MAVPELRFKDENGRDYPEWEEKTLGNALSIGSGKDYKHLSNGDIPVYGTGGYMLSVDKYLYDGESVCIGRKGTIDKPKLLTGKFWTVDTLFYTHSFNDCIPKFIYATFLTIDWKNHNEASGVPSLSKSTIEKIEISLPSLPEQTKIANFLTAVDDKISQLTEKIELITQYKQGVMQSIFSQEIRFKDEGGRDYPEWDYVELNTIAVKVNKKNKGLNLNNVLTNSAIQGVVSQSDYFERDIANQDNLGGYYIVENDDFVYNPRISSNALVGPLKRNNLVAGVMSPLYTVFRFNTGVLTYFEQYFQTNHWHDYMKSVSNSGARHDRMNITNESFFGLPVPYPCKAEQTKIANFLTAFDDKISQVKDELSTAKDYKQGLLQKLFV